jgi:hypothetical protein
MRSLLFLLVLPTPAFAGDYVKRDSRAATAQATLASFNLPTLAGDWRLVGPFDNRDGKGFDTAYPPEKGVDFTATYEGKGGRKVSWQRVDLTCGRPVDLLAFVRDDPTHVVGYVALAFESKEAVKLTVSFGADDNLSVFFNGKRLLHERHEGGVEPDQFRADLDVVVGANSLLLKVGQNGGQFGVVVEPLLPASLPATVRKQYERDYPQEGNAAWPQVATAEQRYYPLTTIEPPADVALEIGGLAFRPDGQLLVCTRRGEIWRVSDPAGPKPMFHLFATGLHEPLGMAVESNNEVYVIQRPELTKLADRSGKGMADEFVTVSNRYGVSGDYHEYAFGPARGKDGSFFVTLNVGFGGGHQAKVPWRGWCVRIDPKTGATEPWAYGLRSPNGVNVSPDGELFYADNQGEWVATNKLCHIQKGDFFGHQAGLRWLPESPFKDRPANVSSGLRYDGGDGKFPAVKPPAVWFPFGRMGQSLSEPVWDTTGRFGPFAGQIFVGDQTRASVMRVALEKVNGVYQGACFPFRAGLQCGVNRLCFGPDGSLYAGQTNRGWGSIGGKPYGLQRIAYAGKPPLEIHSMAMTKAGFEFRFTQPVDPKTVATPVRTKSFTYVYHSTYGCPETDTKAETPTGQTLSADGKTLSVTLPAVARGRVYEFRFEGVTSPAGEPLLHGEAYYTVNETVK